MPTLMLVRRPASVIGPPGTSSRSRRGDVHVVALAVDLVRRRHVLVEHLLGDRHQARMRDPGAVVAVGHFALLVRRTLASASSFAAGSFLIGICAAMPPIACMPRRWQVLMQQQRRTSA